MSIALDYAEFSRKAAKLDMNVRDMIEAAFYAGAESVLSQADAGNNYESVGEIFGALSDAQREVDLYEISLNARGPKKREEDDQA